MPSLEEAMRQSEDGIEQLDDGLITPVNDVFMINPETRVIEVPESEKLFGVIFDKDVERKYFKCPKIVGNNVDLSKHKIYVVYQKANESITTVMGEVGKYWCEDAKVDETGDYIEFSWLLSGNVLEEQGFIAFKVVAVYTDTETGELKTRWNTIPSIGLVRYTLSDGEEITEQYADVISQLLSRMDVVEDIATPEAMQGYVEKYLGEHPVDLDDTLTDSKKAAPANLVGQLKGDLDEIKTKTIETILPNDSFCYGTYRQGILNSTYKYNIATISYVKPYVVSAKVVSADYQLSVVVYKNGVYFKTEGWLSNGTVYTFDHTAYQYKLYIGKVVNGYINDFEECRKSIMLTISTADILKSYNELEIKNEIERRNTKNAVEYMMRRKYDISYANAPAPLGLITYVGNNQVVHPKVLYFPNKFGNRKYWMAYTPYPFANDKYENPCVAYSSDGYNWTNIDGNPLDDPAGDGYNSDTHLVYVESTGTLEIWYRYVSNYKTPPVSEIIYRQTTKDGINWTEKEVVVNNTSGKYTQWLSPAVIHDEDKYKVWVVDDTTKTINYYESTVASSAVTINLDDSMTVGRVDQNGRFDTSNTDYMHTEKIKLNAAKSFQLTGVNLKGAKIHPAIRYITAYDASGNVLADYSQQNIAEASVAVGRTITMNASVDSVIVTIYKASNYTDKAIMLPAVGSDNGLAKVRDIKLTYKGNGQTYNPWHLDVIEDDGKTVLLVMCKSGTTWSLFLSSSADNIEFSTPELVVLGNPYGWDTRMYRSSIVNVDGEYRIYYSAQNEVQKYGLGVCTSDKLSNFVGKW